MTRPFALAGFAALFLAAPAAAQQTAIVPGVWTYAAEATQAELVFRDASGLGLMALTCVKDSGQITAEFPSAASLAVEMSGGRWLDRVGRPAPWPVSVTLASGEAQTTIPGEARPDSAALGSVVSVEFSDRAPVAAAFGRTGELRLSGLEAVVAPPAAPRRDLRRFMSFCR